MFNLKHSFFDTAFSLYQCVVMLFYGCADIYRIIFYIVELFLLNESEDFGDLIPEVEALIPRFVNSCHVVWYSIIYSLFTLYFLVNHIFLIPLCCVLELKNFFSYLCCLFSLILTFVLSGVFDWDFFLDTSNWRTELYPNPYPNPYTTNDYHNFGEQDLGENDHSSSKGPSSDSVTGIDWLKLFKFVRLIPVLLCGTVGVAECLIGIIVYVFFNNYTPHKLEAGSDYKFYRFLVYWFASVNVYTIMWLFGGF